MELEIAVVHLCLGTIFERSSNIYTPKREQDQISIHIPPNGKFGKSSTQICRLNLGDMLIPWRVDSWWWVGFTFSAFWEFWTSRSLPDATHEINRPFWRTSEDVTACEDLEKGESLIHIQRIIFEFQPFNVHQFSNGCNRNPVKTPIQSGSPEKFIPLTRNPNLLRK